MMEFFLNIADVPKHAKTQKVDRVFAECNKVNCVGPDMIIKSNHANSNDNFSITS